MKISFSDKINVNNDTKSDLNKKRINPEHFGPEVRLDLVSNFVIKIYSSNFGQALLEPDNNRFTLSNSLFRKTLIYISKINYNIRFILALENITLVLINSKPFWSRFYWDRDFITGSVRMELKK